MYGSVIRGMGLSAHELNARPVKVYDVEAKRLINTYESVNKAAKALGIDNSAVSRHLKNKTRCHKNNLNKIICFR